MVDSHLYAGKMGWPEEALFEAYFERALSAGINLFGVSLSNLSHDFETACNRDLHLRSHIDAFPQKMAVVNSRDQAFAVLTSDKIGFFYSAQGPSILEGDPKSRLPRLKSMGLGTLSLTYNFNEPAGDGCLADPRNGISSYGQDIIEALVEHGIALDLSHASDETALSAISYHQQIDADRPVIVSHSTPHAVCASYRNFSDDVAQAVADTNGVIAINTSPWFLVDPKATETRPADILRAINYLRDLVGVDHIALASDDVFQMKAMWDVIRSQPVLFDTQARSERAAEQAELTVELAKSDPYYTAEAAKIYPALVDAMWAEGYTDEEISKVLGGNVMRVLFENWTS